MADIFGKKRKFSKIWNGGGHGTNFVCYHFGQKFKLAATKGGISWIICTVLDRSK